MRRFWPVAFIAAALLVGAVGTTQQGLTTTGPTYQGATFSWDADAADGIDEIHFHWIWRVEGYIIRDVTTPGVPVAHEQEGWWQGSDVLPAGTEVTGTTATVSVTARDWHPEKQEYCSESEPLVRERKLVIDGGTQGGCD